MSAFGAGILTTALTDVIGFGVTLNPDGSIASITGPTLRRVTADPNGVVNAIAGSHALQTNGGFWINQGGTVWAAAGGASGVSFPDNVPATFGTTAPLQGVAVFVPGAPNSWNFSTGNVSQATQLASANELFQTGNVVMTGALVGLGSGAITVRTGVTDSTNAGGTGGPSGSISLQTGNAARTLGVSGSSGNLLFSTGNSVDANSGSITLQTGTAGGVRGAVVFVSPTLDLQGQPTQLLLRDAVNGALLIGANGALNMLSFDTSNGVESITLNAVQGLNAVDNVSFGVGTSALDRFNFSYSSAFGQAAIVGSPVNAGGASQPTRDFSINTGPRTKTDANAGVPGSGALKIGTGNSTMSFAGGGATGGASGQFFLATGGTDVSLGNNTGGASGVLTFLSGNCTATAGGAAVSGSSGGMLFGTGTSASANTGGFTFQTGASSAVGAVNTGSFSFTTGNVPGVGTTGGISLVTGNAGGAGNSGNIVLTTGLTVGGPRGFIDINAPALDFSTQSTDFQLIPANANALRILQGPTAYFVFDTNASQINAQTRLTTTDGVAAGTVRTVGGLALSTTADSAIITGNGAAQSFNQNYVVPANTFKLGTTLRVHGAVRRTGINAADTALVTVRLGGTIYLTSLALPAAANDRCVFDLQFTSRGAPGGAVVVVGSGLIGWSTLIAVINVAVAAPGNSGAVPAGLATNANLTLDVQITMPNNVGNTAVLEQFNVDVVG